MSRVLEKYIGIPGISNLGKINWKLWRSDQPDLPEGISSCVKLGINSIINLRSQNREKGHVERAGIVSLHFPFPKTFKEEDWDFIKAILDNLHNDKDKPALIHCKHGQDRTGAIVGAYRLKWEGWNMEEVLEEVESYQIYGVESYNLVKRFLIEFKKRV